MEVSTQCRFNNLQFRPSPHIHNFRNKEARLSFSTSLNLLDSYGFSIQFPAFKHSCWRISNIYALPLQFSRIPRLRGRMFRKNYSNSLHNQYKSSRYIAVRSEVAGTGSANAACPLSELQFVSRTRGVLFYAITSIVAIFLFKLMVVAHPFVLLFDQYQRKAHHLIAKIWSLLTISPFFPIEFEGLENLPPQETAAVYVSNHRSFLDIYTLLTLGRSFKFISKTSIFLFPVIGWAMYFLGTIPLKRMDSRSQMDCLKRCMDLIKKGASVFFFPEGTRSKDGKLGTFKKGAFSIAAKTKVPVVPITLMGTGDIMPAGLEGRLYPGSVKVIIHRPIEGNDANMLCDEARKKIADTLTSEGCKIE